MRTGKQRLLIYSQCFIYGGSERLMKSIYENEYIKEFYDITFSYCYFKDYKRGLASDNRKNIAKSAIIPLYLLDNGNFFYKIDLSIRIKFLRTLLKLPFYVLSKLGIYAIWNYIYFFLFIKYQRPDVVHINNGGYPAAKTCNELARLLYFIKNIKVIYQVNGKARNSKYSTSKIIDKWIGNSVDYFITHSQENAEALCKRGFSRKKIINFYSFFKEEENDFNSDEIDKEIGKTDNTILLLSIGFLTYRKGHLFLINALAIIKIKDPTIYSRLKLFIIGNGEDKVLLEDEIRLCKLQDEVIL